MSIISALIVLFVVPAVLSYLTGKTEKSDNDSTEHFVMRPIRELSKLGAIGSAFFMFCIIGAYYAGQLGGFLIVVFGGVFCLGLLLILVTIRGFWDVTVDGCKVTSSRLWIFRKTIDIRDIDHCVMTRGGINVFLKGQSRKAMSIDSLSSNQENWERRMREEGIEITLQSRKTTHSE